MRVAIVGAGIGGLSAALMLARGGHRVVVCECDAAPVPARPDEMWSGWLRPGTPQARLGHSFLGGFRRQMRERLPDVLDQVLAAGAPQLDLAAEMPGDERRPEDAELGLLMARRPVMEGTLRLAVEAEPSAEIRAGCRVLGLIADRPGNGGIPVVTGVETSQGALAVDTVIVAGGRSVPVRRWFADIGAGPVDERSQGCGSACYTRYFRIHAQPGEDEGVATRVTVHRDPGYLLYEIYGADRRTFAAEIAVPVADRPMHRLRDPAVWTAAAMALPEFPEWIGPERSSPISPGVEVMGAERNVVRRFTDGGRPAALGVHVIGDARCQTDSLFAWGCCNALTAAVAVADVMAEHAGDGEAQALALAERVDSELSARYAYSVARNDARARMARGERRWDTTDSGIGLLDGPLLAAAEHDPEVYRAVNRWDLQLDPADQLETRRDIIERARAAVPDFVPPGPDADGIPPRSAFLDVLAGSG